MAQQYSDPESQELSMIFQFELMGIDGIRSGNWDPKLHTLPQLKQIFEKWQTGLEEKGWNSLFWETMIFRVSYRALEMTGNRIGKNQQKCWLSFSMG